MAAYNHFMLSAADRARLVVVLVGARNPQNIGAAARAMRDFGFSALRLVNDYAAPFEAAQLETASSAVASQEILRNASAFTSLDAAIADCTLVLGTTAIGDRSLTQPVVPLAEAAPGVFSALRSSSAARVAFLFGSEKTGLTGEQLSRCQGLTTIPMFDPASQPAPAAGAPPRHLSMNLGQAVAVCLYELSRGGFEDAKAIPSTSVPPATAADRERLTQLLLDVMHVTEYTRRFPANAQEAQVRQLAQSLGADRLEAESWMGFLRQVLWSKRKAEQ